MSDTKTALLVDDNDELRGVAREYLEELGYAVTAAADAEEALLVARAARSGEVFDLLVSDVQMPGLSGVELTDRLLERQSELAVLLISSRGGEPEVRRRLAPGDIAFLSKPFSSNELMAKVGEAFERVSVRRGDAPSETPVAIEQQPAVTSRRGLLKRAAQVLGAVVLVLGMGVAFQSLDIGAPTLPAPPADGGTVRGTTIEIVQPLGPLAVAPDELVWLPIEGATSYAVSLRAIDGSALWRAEVAAPVADVPADVERDLDRAVTYYWSVEALDAESRRLGRSELSPFVIELASQSSAAGERVQ